ncbi:hypothetical protein BBP40_009472 [Aspergillus hancockii]|nr:hypothetical protein BBP40_009472 [Aspergillus hancockii]
MDSSILSRLPLNVKIPHEAEETAKTAFARDKPLTNDLLPGTFFDDPQYLDSLPTRTKALICSIQMSGQHPDRPALSHIESCHALTRYLDTQDDTHLRTAFALCAMSLRYVPPVHPGRGKSNNHMGRLYQRRWERHSDFADLDEAIRHYKIALEVADDKDEVRTEWACDVVATLVSRIQRNMHSEKAKDKDDARAYIDRAIELAGQTPVRARHISTKGEAIRLITAEDDPERKTLLTESIACHHQALELCETYLALPSKPSIPFGMIHRNAGKAYLARYALAKRPEDGEKALSLLHQALDLEPHGGNSWELFMDDLAHVHKARAQISGDADEEAMACSVWREVIETNPRSTTARVNLAEFLRHMAEKAVDQTVANESIEDAIQVAEDAVRLLPAGSSNLGLAYARCSGVHYTKYEMVGDVADINRAVECAQMATSDYASINLWDYYRILGQVLVTRHERLPQYDDLQMAEVAVREAIAQCGSENGEDRASCQWILGKITRAMYDHQRKPETLHKTAQIFLEASQSMRHNVLSKSLTLNDLGNAYTDLFTHEALPEHLDQAIDAYKESLSSLQQLYHTDQHPHVLMVNAALGNVMTQRFLHWRAETDIDSAIMYYRRSLSHTDEHHPRYPMRVANLSYALQLRFHDRQKVDDLREAQRILTVALEGPVPLSDELRTALATRMGNNYQYFFSVSKQLSDLKTADDHYNKAIAVPNASSAARSMAILNKVTNLKKMAEDTDDPLAVEMSDKSFDMIEHMIDKESPFYWGFVLNHADLLFFIYNRKHSPNCSDYGHRALEKYNSLVQMKNVGATVRINVASIAARLHRDVHQDHAGARDSIMISLELLPEAILMHENRLEQLKFIRKCQYVPSMVVSYSLEAGDPASTIIHRLEAGRAFIWDRIEDRPTQLDVLGEADPELAGKFRTLQQRVYQQVRPSRDTVGVELTSVMPGDTSRLQRQRDTDAYHQVLRDIRSLSGFGSFLRIPETPTDLQTYAADAPIVFVNATPDRSDSLIITKTSVYNLPLPFFSMDELRDYAARFIQARNVFDREEEQAGAFSDYLQVMKWLWETAAKPILHSIDWKAYESELSEKPRVIWVSTGWISVLPIHASGDFESPGETNEPRSVHDMVVSSYTTSLKALEVTRQRALRIKGQRTSAQRHAVVVAMETTPGLGRDGDLNVNPEIQAIEHTLAPSFHVDVLSQPDTSSVKTSLSKAAVAHFACHAHADLKDPSRSAILLADHQKKPPPFTVRTLLRLNIKSCELVYLSACESGASKDLHLRDEGIHIAGGFHIAGVPHVISTLWKVSDHVSAQLAGLVYAKLKDGGKDEVDFSRAPYALHQAIGAMQQRGVHPMLLGPFIHSGP